MKKALIMMVRLVCAFYIILLSVSVLAQSVVIGDKFTIESQALSEDRPYWVHVPESYYDTKYTSKQYPVVYLLDGEMHFQSFIGVMHSMSSGFNGNYRIPELIVVAVPNVDRFRDFTPTKDTNAVEGSEFYTSGGGSAFLEFLEGELIPEVEEKYRTLQHRTLVGHSLGGLLTVQSLIENPHLFQAYMIIDPSLWWEDGLLLQRSKELLKPGVGVSAAVYIATPDYAGDNYQESSATSLLEILHNNGSSSLRSTYQKIADVNHGSVPLLAFYNGLTYLFSDFQISVEMILNGPDAIIQHFKTLSSNLGVEYLPPEILIELAGQATAELPEISLEFYKLNAELYPESALAFSTLAVAYESRELNDLAIQNYVRSLELEPSNPLVVEKLQELRSN